jgi:aminoglycoside phosphotransferase (APT) family kinase protein
VTVPAAPAFDPVPDDATTVLDPAWLATALDLVTDGDRIVDVEPGDSSRTVAEKLRFTVTVEGADGGRRRHPLCAKGHFGDGFNSLLTEAHAYRDLLPGLAVRAPRAHYCGIDDAGGRGLILMDDVDGLGGRFVGSLAPYPVETCRDSLGQLAALHAGTWGAEGWSAPWLAPRVARMARMWPAGTLQDLLDDGRAADVPPVLRDAGALQAAMAATAEVPATCVLHGDTHSGNAYFDRDGRVCWLDWQVAQRGHWSLDVSYHLGTVLDTDTRRTHERDLLEHYLAALAGHGVTPPPWDEAWERYTLGFTWGFFLWTITRISSREVVLIHLPRLGAALADHETFPRLGVT